MKPVFLVAEAVEKPLDELQDRIEEQKDEVTCLTKLHEYVFSRELFTNNTFYLVLGVYFFDQIGKYFLAKTKVHNKCIHVLVAVIPTVPREDSNQCGKNPCLLRHESPIP